MVNKALYISGGDTLGGVGWLAIIVAFVSQLNGPSTTPWDGCHLRKIHWIFGAEFARHIYRDEKDMHQLG